MLRPALFLLVALLPLAAGAQVYRWVDDKGQVHYTQVPPPGAKTRELAPPPPASAAPNQESLNQGLQDAVKAEPKVREEAAKTAEAAAQREQQCRQAREQLAFMDSMGGRRRMTTTDEQGNMSRASDEQVSARRAELEALAASACR
jgi:hypothetical protein